jgi:hypothetical protein
MAATEEVVGRAAADDLSGRTSDELLAFERSIYRDDDAVLLDELGLG